MRRILAALAVLIAVGGVTGAALFSQPNTAAALSGSQFKAGNIISDAVFYNASAMNASNVQSFLNAHYNGCNSGYTCLRDYATATNSRPAESGLCSAYTGKASETSAAIIANVGRVCGVNPQVLLVTLQKESGLVTATSPSAQTYRTAMGFGCPDSTGCDSKYYGFFNQVYGAARSFKYYRLHPTDYNYVAGRNNYILYNPKTSCGGTQVFIENQATAGLYDYTPYQPNAAALANLNGTGDSCSAYGNRNFWVYFNTWFTVPAVPSAPYDVGGLVATRPDGTFWYYRSNGTASAPYSTVSQIGVSGWQHFNRIVTGDIDGDGRADVVATRPDGSLWRYLNTGTSQPYSGGPLDIGASGWGAFDRLMLGDVNGDGRADLIATKPDGSLWLYVNNGNAAHPFATRVNIGASGWHSFPKIVVGDVNGDGRADLVVTKANGSLSLFLNTGNIAHPFSGSATIGASGWASFTSIVATDVDVDGRADLVMTKADGSLWLSHNVGGGQPLAAAIRIGASGWDGFDRIASTTVPVPRHAVSADLIATKPAGQLYSFANNGTPTPFDDQVRIGVSGWSGYDLIVPADVDGDGKSDLLARKPGGSLWLYHGSGSLTRPYGTAVEIGKYGWDGFSSIVAADVDGDGKADLVVTDSAGALWLYPNTGDLAHPYGARVQIGLSGWQAFNRIVAGDVTGDGRTDLVAAKPDGSLWLYANSGNPAKPFPSGVNIGASGWQSYDHLMLTALPTAVPHMPADLIATRPDGSLWLFRNTGSSSHPFTSAVRIGASGWSEYDQLATADVNANGNADLLAGKPDGSLWLYAGGSVGPFKSATLIGASAWQGFDKIAAGDLTGDGLADLVATKPNGQLWYYRNDGDPSHPYSTALLIGASGWDGFDKLLAGDVTGDGRADLLGIKPNGQLWLYVNTGSDTRPYSSGVLVGASGWDGFDKLAMGDVDGDGLDDLVGTLPNGSLWLYRNQHNPSAPFSSRLQIGGGWQTVDRIAVADVDHNGRADLVATHPDGSMWFYVNTGNATKPFSGGSVQLQLSGWQAYDRFVL